MKRLALAALLIMLTSSASALEISDLKTLAERGYASAQFNLGIAYDTGTGVRRDHTEAVKWYRLAAEKGHIRAQNNLAASYGRGEGVPQDYSKALKWYSIAAKNGDGLARRNLASVRIIK
jgi:TPR repeat protein